MVQIISLLIVVLVSAILGLLAYYNNPKSDTNRLLSLFSASMIFWALVMYLTLHPPLEESRLFLIRLSMLAAIIMSTILLFLSHTLPNSKFRLARWKTLAILGLGLAGCVTALSPYMFTHLDIQGTNIEPIAGPGMIMFLITGLGYSISGIVILFKKYRKSTGIQKQQLRFVLVGITVMHVLLITANFLIVILFKNSYFISFGPFFTLAFLLSVFYAITRHRFLEIRLIVMRAISFTTLIALTVLTYTSVFFAVSSLMPAASQFVINVLLTVCIGITFAPVKRGIENLTSKVFFRKGYQSNLVLSELGEIITSTLSISTITTKVMMKLSNVLQPTKIAFLLIEEDKVKVYQNGYKNNPTLSIDNVKSLAQIDRDNPTPYEDITKVGIKQLFHSIEASVIVPLANSNKIFGLLVLGQKKSGSVYSNQDLELLDIFLPQISVGVQNALAYEKIRRFNATLKQEIALATQKLRIANKNLRHLDKLKDEFVYVATHELKNPVTAMKGYLSMIEEGSFGQIPKNLQPPFNELIQSNQQLVNLVNDLLQIARAEAHSLKINTQITNICSVIEAVTNNILPLAQQKHITIHHQCAKNNIEAVADPDKLKEVINNLLSNAIKYSPKGKVTISHAEENDLIITHIKDEGVGIPLKDQAKIFSRFFRVEAEAVKGIPGSGLGLFIVRQLVEKMGGKIWFTSTPGKGSTFSFSLPKRSKN